MDQFGTTHDGGIVTGDETYWRIARGEPVDPEDEGLRSLLALGLVAENDGKPGTYQVLDPQQAQQQILTRARDQLAGLVLAAHLSATPSPVAALGVAPRHLVGLEAIDAQIGASVRGARSEILCAQPRLRDRRTSAVAVVRDRAALQRGVAMRTLYPTSACGRTNIRQWVREMSGAGGEFRVLAGRFVRGIIVDREVAFIDDLVQHPDPSVPRCCMVREPTVVAYLAAIFDATWERALGWGAKCDGDTVTTPVQRAILRELIGDRTIATTAKVLDMSERMVNERLHELRDALGVGSTYAALAWWLRSDEYDLS